MKSSKYDVPQRDWAKAFGDTQGLLRWKQRRKPRFVSVEAVAERRDQLLREAENRWRPPRIAEVPAAVFEMFDEIDRRAPRSDEELDLKLIFYLSRAFRLPFDNGAAVREGASGKPFGKPREGVGVSAGEIRGEKLPQAV